MIAAIVIIWVAVGVLAFLVNARDRAGKPRRVASPGEDSDSALIALLGFVLAAPLFVVGGFFAAAEDGLQALERWYGRGRE